MKALKIIKKVLSFTFTAVCILAFVFAAFACIQAKTTGEPAAILGYRPVLVLTGSMEPYMETNGVVITKNISSLDEIEVGDVVTYHVYDDFEEKEIRVTHRVKEITDDGVITTKGDNNRTADVYPLTIDNVESKVVAVWNWTATVIEAWKTTSGKVMILSIAGGIILLIVALGFLFKKEKPVEE